jgi:hypothetical protein
VGARGVGCCRCTKTRASRSGSPRTGSSPRFHLEGVEAGRCVSVFKIDPGSGERLALLATVIVGEGGWVDLAVPITVRAGEAFIVVPGQAGQPS